MPQDHLGMLSPEKKDLKQFGIKGMKWGIRRSERQLAKARKKNAKSGESGSDQPKGSSKKSDGPESDAERYSRLTSEIKSGRTKKLSDDDIRFVNARAEAMARAEAYVNGPPQSDWLAKTTGTVLKNSAQRQMQSVTDLVATKYITNKVQNKLKETESVDDAIRKGTAEVIRNRKIKSGIAANVKRAGF